MAVESELDLYFIEINNRARNSRRLSIPEKADRCHIGFREKKPILLQSVKYFVST